MGLIADIINHSQNQEPAERNRLVIDAMLTDDHLNQIANETWQDITVKGLTVPKFARSDDFKDKVLKAAKDVQDFWKTYTSENPLVKHKEKTLGFTTKTKAVTLPHKVMLEKFVDLKNRAQGWLKEHSNAEEDSKKKEHCEEFFDMARRGIRQVERNMLQDKPDDKRKAENCILKYGITGKDYSPELLSGRMSEFAKETKLPEEFVVAAWRNLTAEATEILPEGFDPMGWTKAGTFANPNLPKEARPKLTADEATAVNCYSAEGFALGMTRDGLGRKKPTAWLMTTETKNVKGVDVTNETEAVPFRMLQDFLQKGKELPEVLQPVLANLRSAFQKCPVMDPPIDVVRGLDIAPERMQAFKQKYALNNIVTEDGFASAAAKGGADAKGFSKNVKLVIKANRGLDLSPYSNSTEEMELLLDHHTQLRVDEVIDNPQLLVIKCVQL